jgi:hypothetical protein
MLARPYINYRFCLVLNGLRIIFIMKKIYLLSTAAVIAITLCSPVAASQVEEKDFSEFDPQLARMSTVDLEKIEEAYRRLDRDALSTEEKKAVLTLRKLKEKGWNTYPKREDVAAVLYLSEIGAHTPTVGEIKAIVKLAQEDFPLEEKKLVIQNLFIGTEGNQEREINLNAQFIEDWDIWTNGGQVQRELW